MSTTGSGIGKVIFIYILLCAALCMICYGMAAANEGLCGIAVPLAAEPQRRCRVVIDPGHGGEDGGCSGKDGTVEKDINLALSLTMADIMRAAGADVTMTRTEDILLYDRNADYKGRKKVLDLKARLDCAKAHPDAMFISIHMNAFPQEKWHGLQVWYAPSSSESFEIADSIRAAVCKYLQPDNTRRPKAADSGIFLLDRAVTPAVLVECGFLSNPEECARLASADYQKKLAIVIAYTLLSSAGDAAY